MMCLIGLYWLFFIGYGLFDFVIWWVLNKEYKILNYYVINIFVNFYLLVVF